MLRLGTSDKHSEKSKTEQRFEETKALGYEQALATLRGLLARRHRSATSHWRLDHSIDTQFNGATMAAKKPAAMFAAGSK
jgi:hypothetical protein